MKIDLKLKIKEPIFLVDLLRDLLKAGIITRYEKISDIEWELTYSKEMASHEKFPGYIGEDGKFHGN